MTPSDQSLPPEIRFIERGWFNSNQVLVEATDSPTLIDSGHVACAEETVTLLRGHGIEPEGLGMIVSTHCHSDHHGANRLLKELSGAPVALGELTARWFSRQEKRLTWLGQFSQEADIVQADVILRPGEPVNLSGLPFEVLALPGHAPDSLGFYQPDTQVMLTADAMWLGDLGVLHPAVHGWKIIDHAMESLRTITQRKVRIALPGHGPMITEVAHNAEKLMLRLETFKSQPKRLAEHLLRRFVMYAVLCYQPLPRPRLFEGPALDSWDSEYLDLILGESLNKRSGAKLVISRMVDEFLERGLLEETDRGLCSNVSR